MSNALSPAGPTVNAAPLLPTYPMSLSDVLEALAAAERKVLDVETMDGNIGAGYHITEVKAGSFVALDCGGNHDTWQETILQIEDLPASMDPQMTADKFIRILGKVQREVVADVDARLTLEVGPPGAPMRIFDALGVAVQADRAVLRLRPRPAICKPRHRVESGLSLVASTSCCGAPTGGKTCCA